MYSLTQSGNLVVFAGLLVWAAKQFFGFEISNEESTNLITAALTLVGIITSWVGRYRRGDLTIVGFRK